MFAKFAARSALPLSAVSGDVGPASNASPRGALFCSGWPRGDDDADDAADAASVTSSSAARAARRRAVWPPRAPVARVHPGVSSESASVPRLLPKEPPRGRPAVGLLDCRGRSKPPRGRPAVGLDDCRAVGLEALDRRELANCAS